MVSMQSESLREAIDAYPAGRRRSAFVLDYKASREVQGETHQEWLTLAIDLFLCSSVPSRLTNSSEGLEHLEW